MNAFRTLAGRGLVLLLVLALLSVGCGRHLLGLTPIYRWRLWKTHTASSRASMDLH